MLHRRRGQAEQGSGLQHHCGPAIGFEGLPGGHHGMAIEFTQAKAWLGGAPQGQQVG